MRILLLWGMNIYLAIASLYLLVLHWGFLAFGLLLLGPLVGVVAPLLVGLVLDNYFFLQLLIFGNLALIAAVWLPVVIDENLPKNKINSWMRFLVVSIFAIVFISQGVAFVGLFMSAIFNEGSPGVLGYLVSAIGGIMGGYYLVIFNQAPRFEDFISKKMLYLITIPINLIMLFGNINILDAYVVNSVACLIGSIYFIKNSRFA